MACRAGARRRSARAPPQGGRRWTAICPPRHAGPTSARGIRVTPSPAATGAQDRFQRAELQPAQADDAAPCQDLLQPLAVGTAGPQDDQPQVGLAEQIGERPVRRRAQQRELLLEDRRSRRAAGWAIGPQTKAPSSSRASTRSTISAVVPVRSTRVDFRVGA